MINGEKLWNKSKPSNWYDSAKISGKESNKINK